MDSAGDPEDPVLDSAEYLFKNTKYHDCQLTVGDPSLDDVEKIGVATIYLVSQSTVFRAMLEDSELADPAGQNTCITDINPEVFKLMLRFMYGGKMPQVSRDTLAELLLCADKYNVQPLVKWSSSQLVPTSVNELFPALKCVTYVNIPDLLLPVTKLLQESTKEVMDSKQFLDLDDKCIEFITKQDTLAVSELQLWLSLVGWVKGKTEDHSQQRRLLTKPLKHVRFLLFTQDQIVNEVMSSNILSPAEVLHILSAVTNNQAITLSDLCSIKEKRALSGVNFLPVNTPKLELSCTVDLCSSNRTGLRIRKSSEYSLKSSLSIVRLREKLLLQSFVINTRSLTDEEDIKYYLSCLITVVSYLQSSSVKETFNMKCEGFVVRGMGDFTINLKLKSGEPLILEPGTSYAFQITFTKPHPVFLIEEYKNKEWIDETQNEFETILGSIRIDTPFHIKTINYMI